MGKSTQEFLLGFRMAKAAELLRQPQYTVGDIGNAVGYRNPLHFSRAFKNLYGVSPRAWRNGDGGQGEEHVYCVRSRGVNIAMPGSRGDGGQGEEHVYCVR